MRNTIIINVMQNIAKVNKSIYFTKYQVIMSYLSHVIIFIRVFIGLDQNVIGKALGVGWG